MNVVSRNQQFVDGLIKTRVGIQIRTELQADSFQVIDDFLLLEPRSDDLPFNEGVGFQTASRKANQRP